MTGAQASRLLMSRRRVNKSRGHLALNVMKVFRRALHASANGTLVLQSKCKRDACDPV